MNLTTIKKAEEIVLIARETGEVYNDKETRLIQSIMSDKAAYIESVERKAALLKQIFLIFGEIDQEGEPLQYMKVVFPVFNSILEKYDCTLVEIYEAAKMTASKEINAIKFGKISADFIGTFLHVYITVFRKKYKATIRKAENRKARLGKVKEVSKAPENGLSVAFKNIVNKYKSLYETGEVPTFTQRELRILTRCNFYKKVTNRVKMQVYKALRKKVLSRLDRELHELKSNDLISDHIVSAKEHFIKRFKTAQTVEAYETKEYITIQLFDLLIKSNKTGKDMNDFLNNNYKHN